MTVGIEVHTSFERILFLHITDKNLFLPFISRRFENDIFLLRWLDVGDCFPILLQNYRPEFHVLSEVYARAAVQHGFASEAETSDFKYS